MTPSPSPLFALAYSGWAASATRTSVPVPFYVSLRVAAPQWAWPLADMSAVKVRANDLVARGKGATLIIDDCVPPPPQPRRLVKGVCMGGDPHYCQKGAFATRRAPTPPDASYIPDASGPDTLYDTVRRVVHPRRVGPRRLVRHCTTRRTVS